MSHLPISLLTLLSVVACAPVASNEPPPGGENGGEGAVDGKPRMTGGALPPEEQIRVGPGLRGDAKCSPEAAQRFVGKNADEDTVHAAVAASGAALARVIRPGMMVTMDFRGDRLNLRLDDGGRIIAITCG